MKQLFCCFVGFSMITYSSYSQKIIKVKCDMPASLTQGKKHIIKAVVFNNDTMERSGTITLELINPSTKNKVDEWFVNIFAFQFFNAAKNDSCVVKFPIQVPNHYAKHLTYRIVASSKIIKGEDDLVDIITDEIGRTIPIQKKEKPKKIAP
jgi:hypothetical protein